MPQNDYITSNWKYEDLDVSNISEKYLNVRFYPAEEEAEGQGVFWISIFPKPPARSL